MLVRSKHDDDLHYPEEKERDQGRYNSKWFFKFPGEDERITSSVDEREGNSQVIRLEGPSTARKQERCMSIG